MEIKDYLHLYIGQKVWTAHKALNNGEPQALTITINNLHEILHKYEDSKLILRPLSDMTEEEKSESMRIYYTDKIELLAIMDVAHFELCRYLLKQGLDLFNLIPAGLAIDKTSLKN